MFQTSNNDTHKTIRFVYFHSMMKYGIFSGVIRLPLNRY